MMYLPITVFAVLVGSLLYALFFGPTLGALFGKVGSRDKEFVEQLHILEHGDVLTLKGFTGVYARFLDRILRYPLRVLLVVMVVLYSIFSYYGEHSAGFIYFLWAATWATCGPPYHFPIGFCRRCPVLRLMPKSAAI